MTNKILSASAKMPERGHSRLGSDTAVPHFTNIEYFVSKCLLYIHSHPSGLNWKSPIGNHGPSSHATECRSPTQVFCLYLTASCQTKDKNW